MIYDIIGKKFGRLTVISFNNKVGEYQYYLCRCDCGNEKVVNIHNLKTGGTKSCGCLLKESSAKTCKSRTVDFTGQRFGRLLVIEMAPQIKKKQVLWKCKCDCGNEVIVNRRELKAGHTKSCGCLHKELLRKPPGEAALTQLFNSYKGAARRRNYEFRLTRDEFKSLVTSNCYYCGKPPERVQYGKNHSYGGLQRNGIDRVNNTKGYILENVVPCCLHCNMSKGVSTLDVFRVRLEKRVQSNINEIKDLTFIESSEA